jgi:hypothetical protein
MNKWVFAKDVQVDGFYTSGVFLESHDRRAKYLKNHGHNIRWIQYSYQFDRKDVILHRLAGLDIAKYCPNLVQLVASTVSMKMF